MKRLVSIVLLVMAGNLCFSQDPQFTQFYSSPVYLAPSFAGSTKGKRIATSYRNQWPALKKSFVTYSFSYDHYLPTVNSGLGLLFLREQAGTGILSTTNIGLSYSYHLKLSHEWRVIPGIELLYTQNGLHFHKLTFGSELLNNSAAVKPEPQNFTWDVDAGASALFYSENIWMGFTADHLLEPNQSLTARESTIPMRFSLFGGMKIPINSQYGQKSRENLFPAFHLMKQGENSQLNMGLYWNYTPFMIGMWYRGIPLIKDIPSNDAAALLVGYNIDQFTIGYSYDITVSNLAGLTQGAHEISLMYTFGRHREPREKMIKSPCPISWY
ncbi:MAG: PorP/SprF family type IX secretion system membrane protein [Bacteroidota bacterium]